MRPLHEATLSRFPALGKPYPLALAMGLGLHHPYMNSLTLSGLSKHLPYETQHIGGWGGSAASADVQIPVLAPHSGHALGVAFLAQLA